LTTPGGNPPFWIKGRLDHRGAAGRQRRGQRAHRHAEREIPWDDVRGHAQRLQPGEIDDALAQRDHRALDLVGRTGVVAQRLDHAVDVAARGAHGFSHVARLQPRQRLALPGHQIGEAIQQAPAIRRRQLAPGAAPRRVRRRDRPLDLGRAATGHVADHLLGRGVDGGKGATVRRGDRLAVDDVQQRRQVESHPLRPPADRPATK
jgi:hypothetical protein